MHYSNIILFIINIESHMFLNFLIFLLNSCCMILCLYNIVVCVYKYILPLKRVAYLKILNTRDENELSLLSHLLLRLYGRKENQLDLVWLFIYQAPQHWYHSQREVELHCATVGHSQSLISWIPLWQSSPKIFTMIVIDFWCFVSLSFYLTKNQIISEFFIPLVF